VSGGGPYGVQPTRFYFEQRATTRLHSELGMPAIVSYDSLRAMMPEKDRWPQGLVWGLHDFNLTSAQRLSDFRAMLDTLYGGANDAEEWVKLAQLMTYDGYRAMFEAQGRNRMGLLLWMSHPAWPSLVWQTYDYYLEPTAAYFGAKKGAEPLHIQWNPTSNDVEVVNYSAGSWKGLEARAEVLNVDGSSAWERSAPLDSAEDSLVAPIRLEFPDGLSAVHFVRLRLERAGKVLSENLYWRAVEGGSFEPLRTLPEARLVSTTRSERVGERYVLTTKVRNTSDRPAVMVRLLPVRSVAGDRILPALIGDSYFFLMPGERREIRTEIEVRDARGEEPRIAIEALNAPRTLSAP
jgi:hypothetical protein